MNKAKAETLAAVHTHTHTHTHIMFIRRKNKHIYICFIKHIHKRWISPSLFAMYKNRAIRI